MTEPPRQPVEGETSTCDECHGTGKRDHAIDGQVFRDTVCEGCGGSGKQTRSQRQARDAMQGNGYA